jgi:hypothetical protein
MDRFWRGGTASWDGTAGTKWADTVGGAGGASVPTSADDVYFDATSGAVTCTIAAGNTGAKSITCTGFTGTLTGSTAITVSGSITLVAAMTFTYSGTLTLAGTGTITSAGKTFLCPTTINGSGITVTLGDALTNNSGGNFLVSTGTFNTNNFNLTLSGSTIFNSSAVGNVRAINLGSSTVSIAAGGTALSFAFNSGLTFNAGTSTIICSGTSAQITGGAAAGGTGVTFYNVQFTATAVSTHNIVSSNTFNNLTVTSPAAAGVTQFTFDSRQTINGTLSTTGTAGNRRVWFRGATYGLAQTLTINSAPSLTDADFRDIYVIGTAAPISGTRIGDLRGIRGITASTPKTVYWNLVAGGFWSANAWAASSGGGVSTDNFPLAQDTAIIENTGLNNLSSITLDSAIVYIGTISMSTRTLTMTLSQGNNYTVYGNWTNGSGTGFGGGATLTFSGRNTQTITSAGKTFISSITIDSYGGTVELTDPLNIGSNTLTVTNGTFDTKNYNVTAGSLSSSNSNVRTINLGSSTVTLSTGSGNAVNFGTFTNLTFVSGTSNILLSAGAAAMDGGGRTFYNVTYSSTSITGCYIGGVPIFNNLTFTAPASSQIAPVFVTSNLTITGTLTVAGATAVRRIFLRSDTLGTTRTLTVNSLSATDCDFRDITIAGTAAGSSPTRAGDCGGNTGITFPAAKTVYWNLAGTQVWSATGWCPSSGGTPDINQFPLAQDTAVFDDAGAVGTVTVQTTWNIGTLNMSSRTSACTIDWSNGNPNYHGNVLLGSGVTPGTIGESIFAGRGTQTITSGGNTWSGALTVNSVTGTVQLADALTLISARTLTLTSGTFDAVSYNVTTGLFSGLPAVAPVALRMGSGTWTLSGTGTVWLTSTVPILYKGTANIVLSDTSTSSRTFAGNSYSYNKLTIGGTTGTSTTTIAGNNQFTEIASTKTVAHTIALGTTTQTFGAWTVTGTAGNVVTVTGTAALTIAGAAVSGVDYLALGTTTVSATSPGEFYAGANSTATSAAAPLYLTAKPADSTRYWVNGAGNWSDTARWSTSSGGGSGASVPRSHDDVVFDALSNATAYTATVNAVTGGIRTKALTIAGPLTGNLTLAGSTAIVGIHGNVTLPATGLTRTYTGVLTLSGSSSATFTTNGVAFAQDTILNGVGCTWTLGSSLTLGSTNNFQLLNGTFNTGNYNCTFARFRIIPTPIGNLITLNLGSSTITENTIGFTLGGALTGFTFNAGTSTINNAATAGTAIVNPSLEVLTFYNYNFTAADTATITISGTNTFNNLSFTGKTSAGIKNIILSASQTINGTLTLSAGTNATMRTFVRSDTLGTTRTLTCAAFSGTDADFRDITIAGAAAPVSGTRLGDCKGNSGITFGAGVTRYWNLASGDVWSGNGWAATSGGSPAANNFPLAQDTAVFEATGLNSGATITFNAAYNIGTINMSARTSNTMTLTATAGPTIYGNWINGTGTTLTGTSRMTFAGRVSQTITSAGKTFTQSFTIQTPGGFVAFQDAFTTNSTNNFELFEGTIDGNSYNVTLSGSGAQFAAGATNPRTIAIGSGIWTVAGAVWSTNPSTNCTITGTGTISLTSASAKTFAGGGISYSGITLNQGGAGTLTISGNNTFKSITNTYSATGATTIALGTTTQTLAQPWTATGEASRVLTVRGTSASSPGTLVFTGSGLGANVDYLAITGVRAYDLTDEWYAGANSTNNGSLGWYFVAGGVIAITASVSETSTASDAVAAFLTVLASTNESATATDTVDAPGSTYNPSLSETATATDAISTVLALLAQVADAATATDTTAVQMVLSTNLAETATATDAVSGSLVFAGVVLESATATDTTQSAVIFVGAIAETATATDLTASLAQFLAQVAETSTATDVTLVAPSVFGAQVQEAVAALDLVSAFGTFNVQFVDSATALDSVLGAFLWNLIDDGQNANWVTISTPQVPTWTSIDDSQNANWQNINNI